MVAEAKTFVDVEAAVREWARDAVTTADRRVFFAANNKVNAPQIVLFRIAGTDEDCLLQCDCWAPKKEQASAMAVELETAAHALGRYESTDGVILHGMRVDNSRWLPDEESLTPRYVVEITVTATAAQ